MTDKILKYMEEYHMLPENGNIVVGVSGGADSVCLLYTLVKLRDRMETGLSIIVVHVNHKLRQEAGEDAAFVESLCEKWRVPFVLVEEDVERLAKKERLSCEEAGRLVRYRAFSRTLAQMDGCGAQESCDAGTGSGQKNGGAGAHEMQQGSRAAVTGRGCIAVAHNRDDRAETFLFHLFRGTGLNGMGSIRPVRENDDGSRIIRPLLSVSRQEIEAFLGEEGVEWRTDHTNAEELYTRNKIRNRILPYAETEICAQVKAHLARESALLADTADFVRLQTQEALKRCALEFPERGELRFDASAFEREAPFLQDQMIMSAIGLSGCQKDMTAAHVEEVKRLFLPSCTSGRKVVLPVLKISARRQFQEIIIKRMDKEQEEAVLTEVPLVMGSFDVPGLGTVCARLLPGPGRDAADTAFFQNIPENEYTKWLDYDKIIKSAMFRTRRKGDYLTINDALCKKSLKRYMIEEKIPVIERDRLMLLADGTHVIWVPGHRISAAYKVTAKTATILEVNCKSIGQSQS